MVKKEKEVATIDDFFIDIRDRKHGELADSFGHYDKVTDKKLMDQMAVNLFQPAMDDWYQTFEKELSAISGLADDKHIDSKNKLDVQKAAIKAFEAFFKKARPSVVAAVKDIDDVEKKYKLLVREYNNHVGAGQTNDPNDHGIETILEGYIGNKQQTLAELKRDLYTMKAKHVEGSVSSLRNKAYSHFIGTYQPLEIASHLKKMAKKEGYEVTDEAKFHEEAITFAPKLYRGLKTGEIDIPLKQVYLKKKKDKKDPIPFPTQQQQQQREA